jgi:16S rRNA (cytosine1402-N4)-methyltransferase
MEHKHTPVMLKEVIEYLKPTLGGNFIDCTLGGGGYSRAILERVGESGKVLAIDLDELAINQAQANIQKQNLILVHDNFKNLQKITEKYFSPDKRFAGIIFDLGLSSAQLADQSRGFSFNLSGSPLGMNFNRHTQTKAEQIINHWSLADLTKIFKDYGEEKFAHRIALAIMAKRRSKRIATTDELVEIIVSTIPKKFQVAKIHPATKVFQALRLAVNQELENLRIALPQAVNLLKSAGRLAVVSYHSLEDRIVKQYFKQESQNCLCPPEWPVCRCGHRAQLKILTPKVLRPRQEEVLANPRARSAKLRAAEKIKNKILYGESKIPRK